ncbi:dynein heavy chain [Coemansia sp. RSA 1290]|nr:dynein heavy chain [Coemansia sp. RSA 1290]
MEGAQWNGTVVLNDGSAEKLDTCYLQWAAADQVKEDQVVVPVYLNADRNILLFQTSVPVHADKRQIVERAVAIRAA